MERRPPNDPWEIPDLETGPAPVSRPKLEPLVSATVAVSSRAQAASNRIEDGFDDDLAIGLAGYELAGVSDASPKSAPTREVWPHLRPIGPDDFAPTREAIEAIRPWGEPPEHLLSTPTYAFWVYRGQRRLERLIVEQARQVALLDQARSEVVLEWFAQHAAELATHPRSASDYHGLEHVLAELEVKSQAYSQLVESVESAQSEAEQAGAEARERIRAKRAELLSLEEGHREALYDLNREKARRQRLDIELRTGHLDAASHAQQIANLDASAARAQLRVDSLSREMTELEQRLMADEMDLRREEDKLRRLQRREQDKQQAVEVGLDQARSKAGAAKLALVSRLLVLRDAELFAPSVRAQWLSREHELEQAARRWICLLAAKDSFDRDKVRQGLQLVLLALALLVVPLLLRVVL